MATLAGARIFTVGQTVYVWEDIVLAGQLSGEWGALEQRVRDGLACLARLDDSEEDAEDALDEDDVDTAANDFRYARDLIAAADLESWLADRGLTVDAWLDFIRRTLLLERWTDALDDIRESYEIDDDELAEGVVCEAVCSGLAQHLAGRLAARAAIDARLRESGALDVEGAAADGSEHLRRLEETWQRFTARLAPPEALKKVIATHALDWIRFTVAAVIAPADELAREIALCVREDRRAIAEVAAEADLPCETAEWWLEDLEPSVRDALVVAQPGDVVGPLAVKAGQLVLTVADKRLPSDDNPAVHARAEAALLVRTVEHEIAQRVVWHRTF